MEGGYPYILVLGIIGAFMTAAYMGRCVHLTFHGEYRGHDHPHESSRSMTIPLVLLAIPSVGIGFINATAFGIDSFTKWVPFEPGVEEFHLEHHAFDPLLAALSLAAALAGLLVATMVFSWRNAPAQGAWRRVPAFRALNTFLVEQYYLDRLFVGGVVGAIKGPIARAAYWTNQHVIDAVVNAAGAGTRRIGRFTYDIVDQKVVDGAVNALGVSASETGGVLRLVQSGRVQQYALMLFAAVGLLGLAIAFFA